MDRTALQIVQSAAAKLGINIPGVLFGSTDRDQVELQGALIEAAAKVVQPHGWSVLRTLKTDTGTGSVTEFALPSDYSHMPEGSQVWASETQRPLSGITPEDWLQLDVGIGDTALGAWTQFGGNMVYRPAPAAGETVKFWYISQNAVAGTDGTAKATFTADTDTFRLNDRVLELMLICEHRKQKGLDYSEEMRDAESALSLAITRDKGARMISQQGRPRLTGQTAYPGTITP